MSSSDFQAAVQLYEAILEDPSENMPEQIVLLSLGRAMENTGQLEAALEHYRKVTTDYAGTSAATSAQDRIRRIEPRVQPETSEEENGGAGDGETGSEK
jgi:TolA-binding protein